MCECVRKQRAVRWRKILLQVQQRAGKLIACAKVLVENRMFLILWRLGSAQGHKGEGLAQLAWFTRTVHQTSSLRREAIITLRHVTFAASSSICAQCAAWVAMI